jgi:hypothetical protein
MAWRNLKRRRGLVLAGEALPPSLCRQRMRIPSWYGGERGSVASPVRVQTKRGEKDEKSGPDFAEATLGLRESGPRRSHNHGGILDSTERAEIKDTLRISLLVPTKLQSNYQHAQQEIPSHHPASAGDISMKRHKNSKQLDLHDFKPARPTSFFRLVFSGSFSGSYMVPVSPS